MLFPSKGMPSLFSGQIRPIHGTFVASCSRCVASRSARPSDVLILGGTGRIGTAAAAHLIKRTTADDSYVPVVLLGGRSKERGDDAVREVESLAGCSTGRVKFVEVDYQDPHSLRSLLFSGRFGSVIHTAGPFGDDPVVLRQCIAAGVPTYVDVADPIPYIRAANQLCEDAKSAGTTAVICAGAFPGLSNVLGVECASRLSSPPKDLRFSYFTAGLGGSGAVNLLITNEGFGVEMPVFRDGKLSPEMTSGRHPRRVQFYLDETDASLRRVGDRVVWNWPFPEVCTVAEHVGISGNSYTGMGTAPGFYNNILTGMCSIFPPSRWSSRAFSGALAAFSQPMVRVTDLFVGETHCMRVDAVGEDGETVTAVQGHDSFRRCVGQSCAEFLLAIEGGRGRAPGIGAGVYTPERLFQDKEERKRLLDAMTSTEGTFTFRIERRE